MANINSSGDSSDSSSSLSSGDRKRRQRRNRHGGDGDDNDQHNSKSKSDRKRKRKHHKHDIDNDDHNIVAPTLAAPSDWDELRAHYQFVLPEDDQAHKINANQPYGSLSWQERMVQQYHTHLYKEYVLADLSRVKDHGNHGKIGLRWRTEKEVANGRGFNCCGNLMCQRFRPPEKDIGGEDDNGDGDNDGDATTNTAAIKRYIGIGVPENGGKEPFGVILPRQATAASASATVGDSKNDHQNESNNSKSNGQQEASPLERYLQSCAKERRKMEQNKRRQYDDDDDDDDDKKSSSKKQKKKKKHKRRHKRSRSKPYYSLQEQEYKEQHRLSQLHGGIGLHDYEVDFIYIEQGLRKRELVKVRLCLQCAPLLFLSKLLKGGSSRSGGRDNGTSRGRSRGRSHGTKSDDSMLILAPAIKAREAREKAARSHYEEIVVYGRGGAASSPTACSAANETVELDAIAKNGGAKKLTHEIKVEKVHCT